MTGPPASTTAGTNNADDGKIAYPFEVPKKVPGGASSGQYF
jgi:hypothetical protein